MRQKTKRFLMIIAGVWLLLLIMCSFVIYLFFPDLLHPETQETSEATTELFAMDTYGNTAQKKVPNTAECDIIKSWINK